MSYSVPEPVDFSGNGSLGPSPVQPEVPLRGDNVSLSFSTSQSPALLIYVSSSHRGFLALLLNHGEEQRRRRGGG